MSEAALSFVESIRRFDATRLRAWRTMFLRFTLLSAAMIPPAAEADANCNEETIARRRIRVGSLGWDENFMIEGRRTERSAQPLNNLLVGGGGERNSWSPARKNWREQESAPPRQLLRACVVRSKRLL